MHLGIQSDFSQHCFCMGYESFFIGDWDVWYNTLLYDYARFSILATDGMWIKNVWELLHKYNVIACFISDFHLCQDWGLHANEQIFKVLLLRSRHGFLECVPSI